MGLIGQAVKRVEDVRLVTGNGRYVADLSRPHMLHAVVARRRRRARRKTGGYGTRQRRVLTGKRASCSRMPTFSRESVPR